MFGWNQERSLVVTTEHVLNVKKVKLKRKIKIIDLGGVSKTTKGSAVEFTLHVPKQYDYRFLSDK